MDQIKDVPTRDPDEFEKAGLASLSAGESRYVESNSNIVRMVGAIYAGASCVSCHEQRGQLLGAFSYEIQRGPGALKTGAKEVP